MRTLIGQLSSYAQNRLADRSALVYLEESGAYTLERHKREPLGLGNSRSDASQALRAFPGTASRYTQ